MFPSYVSKLTKSFYFQRCFLPPFLPFHHFFKLFGPWILAPDHKNEILVNIAHFSEGSKHRFLIRRRSKISWSCLAEFWTHFRFGASEPLSPSSSPDDLMLKYLTCIHFKIFYLKTLSISLIWWTSGGQLSRQNSVFSAWLNQ